MLRVQRRDSGGEGSKLRFLDVPHDALVLLQTRVGGEDHSRGGWYGGGVVVVVTTNKKMMIVTRREEYEGGG